MRVFKPGYIIKEDNPIFGTPEQVSTILSQIKDHTDSLIEYQLILYGTIIAKLKPTRMDVYIEDKLIAALVYHAKYVPLEKHSYSEVRIVVGGSVYKHIVYDYPISIPVKKDDKEYIVTHSFTLQAGENNGTVIDPVLED